MTAKELAKKLDGREYGHCITREICAEAKEAGLVIVTGASDDLMEFDGAIEDEADCFDGGKVYFDLNGVSMDGSKRECIIEAVWCNGTNSKGAPAAWTYKTDIPHEEFDILEDGDLYCVGIVFSLSDLNKESKIESSAFDELYKMLDKELQQNNGFIDYHVDGYSDGLTKAIDFLNIVREKYGL